MNLKSKKPEKQYYLSTVELGNRKVDAYIEVNEADIQNPIRFKTTEGANYEKIGGKFILVNESIQQR